MDGGLKIRTMIIWDTWNITGDEWNVFDSSHLYGFHCLFMRLASMLLCNEDELHGEPASLHASMDAYIRPAHSSLWRVEWHNASLLALSTDVVGVGWTKGNQSHWGQPDSWYWMRIIVEPDDRQRAERK